MTGIKERHKIAVERFQELLRSGKDYTVEHMYSEVGKAVYIKSSSVPKIIRKYYQQIISPEMICFITTSEYSRKEEIDQFSVKFGVCKRESILLIRYIRMIR